MSDFDRQGPHVHRVGDQADLPTVTPLHGEIIIAEDTLQSPKAYTNGSNPIAGGFLLGPGGCFFGYCGVATDAYFLTPIPWSGIYEKTGEFTHSTSTNNSEVTAAEAGGYSIDCNLTILFAATCYVEVSIQVYNGASWSGRNGAKCRISGVAGENKSVSVILSQPVAAGWKFRVIATNSNFIVAQASVIANFTGITIQRYR